MPPSAEEQDSQVVVPDFPNDPQSSPYQDLEAVRPELSFNTVVTDNRFTSNNPQNQVCIGRDSFKSVIKETQYVAIEMDTQATVAQDSQILGESLVSAPNIQLDHVLPTSGSIKLDDVEANFLRRPIDDEQEDSTTTFRFQVPNKHTYSQFTWPTHQRSSDYPSGAPSFPIKSLDFKSRGEYVLPNIPCQDYAPSHQQEQPKTAAPLRSPFPEPAARLPEMPIVAPAITSTTENVLDFEHLSQPTISSEHQHPKAPVEKNSICKMSHSQVGTQKKPSIQAAILQDLTRVPHSEPVNSSELRDSKHRVLPLAKSTTAVTTAPFDRAISTSKIEHQNLGDRRKQIALEAPSRYIRPPQSEIAHRRYSKGRYQIPMQVPFPDARTPSRGQRQATPSPGLTVRQQLVDGKLGVSIPNITHEATEPSTRCSQASIPTPHPMEIMKRGNYSASVASASNSEPVEDQEDKTLKIRILHQTLAPGENMEHKLEPPRVDINLNPFETSPAPTSPELLSTRSHQSSGNSTNERRPRSSARRDDTMFVAKKLLPRLSSADNQISNHNSTGILSTIKLPSVPADSSSLRAVASHRSDIVAAHHNPLDNTQLERAAAISSNKPCNDNEFMTAFVDEGQPVGPGHPPGLMGSFRKTSPVPYGAEAQATSGRNSHSKNISRPMHAKDLKFGGISRGISSASKSRVSKSNCSHKSGGASVQHSSSVVSALRSNYDTMIASSTHIYELMADYERQQGLLAAQQVEIDQLKASGQFSNERLVALQAENMELDEKIKRLIESSSKYKKHMNEVVKTQKFLKAQSIDLQNTTTGAAEIVAAYNLTFSNRNSTLQKLCVGIKEVKELRAAIGISADREKERIAGITSKLTCENAELRKEIQKHLDNLNSTNHQAKLAAFDNSTIIAERDVLKNERAKLRLENEQWLGEIFKTLEYSEQLKQTITAREETNELLSKDLDKRLAELEREKSNVENLQCVVETQVVHKELIALLKEAPSEFAKELIKDGGSVSKAFAAFDSIQKKIDEATLAINGLRYKQPETPTPFIELIEDAFSRFRREATEVRQAESQRLQSTTQLVEDVKSRIDQLRLDEDAKIRFSHRITELEQKNLGLTIEKTAIERDAQNSTIHLDEIKEELVNCRKQFSTQCNELAVALAIASENPLLRAQIQGLESTKGGLEIRLENATQSILKLNERIECLDETAILREQRVKDLEIALESAQTTLNNFAEKNSREAAATYRENEKVCQELVKTFETKESTLRISFQADLKNLVEKNKAKEVDLSLARAEIQRYQENSVTSDDTIQKINERWKATETELQSMMEEMQRLRDSKVSAESATQDLYWKYQEEEAVSKVARVELLKMQESAETAKDALQETDRKYKENQLELQLTKEELYQAKEATDAADKAVRNFDQRCKALEAELSDAKQEVHKLSQANTILDSKFGTQKAETASFNDLFLQQAAYIKQLEAQNPSRQVYDVIENGLQMARNEITDLRNQLEFIKSSNLQKHASANSGQISIESRLLQNDILERQRDSAEYQVVILKKELEEHKEVLARGIVPNSTRASIKDDFDHVAIAPVLEADRPCYSTHFNTPETSTHKPWKQVGSGSDPSQTRSVQQQATNSLSEATSEPVLNEYPIRGSILPLQQTRAILRKLRAATCRGSSDHLQQPRPANILSKSFIPGQATPTHNSLVNSVKQHFSEDLRLSPGKVSEASQSPRILTSAEDVEVQLQSNQTSKSLYAGSVQLRENRCSASFSSTRVSLTHNTDRMLETSNKRNYLQYGYAAEDSDAPLESSNYPLLARKKPKVSLVGLASSAEASPIEIPTVAQESHNRRTSMPMKSALKKAVLNDAILESKHSEGQPRAHMAEGKMFSPMGDLTRKSSNLGFFPRNCGPSDIPGVVSGKTSKASGTTMGSTVQVKSFGRSIMKPVAEHSPPHTRAPRQAPKFKGVVGRRGSLLRGVQYPQSITVIPDSQGTQ